MALILSSVGVYGLTAFSAASRTREIAMRMALGASALTASLIPAFRATLVSPLEALRLE